MFQMYKVALSAGKAHRDHKHHHVHKFVHNGPAPETTPMPAPAVNIRPPADNSLICLTPPFLSGTRRSTPKPTSGKWPNSQQGPIESGRRATAGTTRTCRWSTRAIGR